MTGNRGQSKRTTKFCQTSWWFCIVLFILIVIWYGFCKSNKVEARVVLEHIALCFCVRNCEPYLKDIFTNIDALRDQLKQTKITCIFVYDNCKDNSEQLLLSYQSQKENVLIENIVNQSRLRTVRIAKARNKCLELLHELQNVQYHFMIDSDDRGSGKWNLDLISTSLQDDEDDWDCLSFNKGVYYDCWALMFDDFKHHVWGFPKWSDCTGIEKVMFSEIKNKLKDSPSDNIDVMSAFNGFAIYKTQRFIGFHYDGLCSNFIKFFTNEERTKLEKMLSIKYGINTKCLLTKNNQQTPECCEHLFYHLSAFKRGRKMKISKFKITP
jgi:hypothetical protein